MHEWLEAAVAELAAATGESAEAFALTDDERERLLELARVAAHDSGDRTNAPLVCYLVGLARGRSAAASTAELVDAVKQT